MSTPLSKAAQTDAARLIDGYANLVSHEQIGPKIITAVEINEMFDRLEKALRIADGVIQITGWPAKPQ